MSRRELKCMVEKGFGVTETWDIMVPLSGSPKRGYC